MTLGAHPSESVGVEAKFSQRKVDELSRHTIAHYF